MVLVPNINGVCIISDKQDSYDDGSVREINKFFLAGPQGPVIGCAGNTRLIQALFSRFVGNGEVNNANVIDRIKEELPRIVRSMAEMSSIGDAHFYDKIELIIVSFNDGIINSYHMVGLVDRILDITRLSFIPEESMEMRQYVRIDTSEFDETHSLIFGEELLRQASFMNHLIGSPEYQGYHYVVITNEGNFTMHEKLATITRLDPSNIMAHITSIVIEEE